MHPFNRINIEQFTESYNDYIKNTIKPIEAEAKRILREWQEPQFWRDRFPSAAAIPMPIRRVYSRIKRQDSILDKLPDDVGTPAREDLIGMRDIFGMRIIVYVESHLPAIDDAIRTSGDFNLHPEIAPKWYYPLSLQERLSLTGKFQPLDRKDSGYASIHYILRPINIKTDAWFEMQVRTMLFDAWGEIEHKLLYKSRVDPELHTQRHLRIMADQLMALEEHFDVIFQRITYLQDNSSPEDDDVITDVNLPILCARWELPILQTQLGKLASILYENGIGTVRDLRERISLDQIERMKNYMNTRGERLTAFHAISVAARIAPDSTPNEAVEILEEQLSMVSNMSKVRERQQ